MFRITLMLVAVLLVTMQSPLSFAKKAVWGGGYFPNTVLIDHEGQEKKFFDDLIKDKVVVINFIYTTCPDVCPMETAQMAQVSRVLGDRVGNDVHLISITIDPEHDTPEVLKEYRERFSANWSFYTGDRDDIIQIRRKLGLYVENIGGKKNNHNVNLIIGNQKTGRWMKRTPFENPHILADQIGNWLHGWKSPQKVKDFAKAPELRNISDGENLFRTRCMSCHTIDGSKSTYALGPDLLGVTLNRDRKWLIRWLRNPAKMIEEDKDPIAVSLYKRYNKVMMPNMDLGEADVVNLLEYFDEETQRQMGVKANSEASNPAAPALLKGDDVVAVMNSWVREALPGRVVNAGYMTLFNVGKEPLRLTGIESRNFDKVEIHEMVAVDGLMEMSELTQLVVPAGGSVSLEPGGKHLMMKGPIKDFIEGETLEMSLKFASGVTQILTVPVVKK